MINSGSYQLYIYIKKKIKIQIGSLGFNEFPKGYYVYTGSAMRNLFQRVERHKRSNKTIRWHIDYLLSDSNVKIKNVILHYSDIKEECHYNNELINKGAKVIVMNFGSSDCNLCDSHLLYIGTKLTLP